MTLKLILLVGGIVVGVVGFLLFRPDTLFTDVRVDEGLGEAFAEPVAEAEDEQMDDLDGMDDMDDMESTEPEIVLLNTGMFSGIGRYEADGTTAIYEQDGQFVLRFEDDTDIQNGPDLYVWVLPEESYEEGTPTEWLDLGRLTGNQGSQNYQLPDEYDPDVHRTVLIWCLRFSVPFASASLG